MKLRGKDRSRIVDNTMTELVIFMLLLFFLFAAKDQLDKKKASSDKTEEDYQALLANYIYLEGLYSDLRDECTNLQIQYAKAQAECADIQVQYGVLGDQYAELEARYAMCEVLLKRCRDDRGK